jgi:hypothetical protein
MSVLKDTKLLVIIDSRTSYFAKSPRSTVDCRMLLADAEFGEDFGEDVGGGDFAGDFAEMAEDISQFLAQQLARNPICQRLAGKR